jgi:hypothetical protein
MVPVFKITVRARPATASKLACFKLHLRAREDTLLAQARFVTWERRDYCFAVFDSHQKGLVAAACRRYGLKVATGAAFQPTRIEY